MYVHAAEAQSVASAARRPLVRPWTALTAGEETARNANAVTTATEQLATSVEEISQGVEQSTRIAGSAEEEARRNDALVRGLVETGSRIGDVVRLIRARRTCWR